MGDRGQVRAHFPAPSPATLRWLGPGVGCLQACHSAAGSHRRSPRPPRPTARPAPLPAEPDAPKKRLAVFVSGGGSNFRAIHTAITEGRVNAEVAVVVSNAPTCGGAQYAQAHGIPTLTFPAPKADPAAGLLPEQLVAALTQELQVGGAAHGRWVLAGWKGVEWWADVCGVFLALQRGLWGRTTG